MRCEPQSLQITICNELLNVVKQCFQDSKSWWNIAYVTEQGSFWESTKALSCDKFFTHFHRCQGFLGKQMTTQTLIQLGRVYVNYVLPNKDVDEWDELEDLFEDLDLEWKFAFFAILLQNNVWNNNRMIEVM